MPYMNHNGLGSYRDATGHGSPGEPTLGAFTSTATDTAFTRWVKTVKANGGMAAAWPFDSDIQGNADANKGKPAAKYPVAVYVSLFNANKIDARAPQRTTGNNQFVYVLASDDVAAAAPHTMTLFERAENAAFTTGDRAADTLGLPSLKTIQHALNPFDLSPTKLIVGGVLAVGGLLAINAVLNRRG